VKLDVVEDVLLGQGGDAETGAGHAPVCPIGRKMFSNLSLNAGLERFDLLEKSAVYPQRDIHFDRDVPLRVELSRPAKGITQTTDSTD
jgi:hypothetical protein